MAIKATVIDSFGEERSLYIRLNNVESSNHGVASTAKFRGFISQQAFIDKCHYLWESDIAFDADVSRPLWPQAYAALKAEYPLVAPVDLMED